MDKIWHFSVIKYLQKSGLTPTEVHADMVDISEMMLQVCQLRKSGMQSSGEDKRALNMIQAFCSMEATAPDT